jgi:hypothetical protein
MSSENLPSAKLVEKVDGKVCWHVQIRCSPQVYELILAEAKRDERSLSYVISKIVEHYYAEQVKLKIL